MQNTKRDRRLCRDMNRLRRAIGAVAGVLLASTLATAASPPAKEDAGAERGSDSQSAPDFSDKLTGDWGGVRSQLNDHGIDLELTFYGDFTKNLRGGLNTAGASGQYLLDARLTIDTEKLIGLPGGTLFLDGQSHDGTDPSLRDTGDFQFLSTINARELHQLSEFWYQQSLADGALRVKFGKIEAESDFAFSDNAVEFLNSGMGYPIAAVIPTYPDQAVGLELFVQPGGKDGALYFGAGMFDGSLQEGILTGRHGVDPFFNAPADLLLIGESGLKWEAGADQLQGQFKLGGFYHTGTFDKLSGTGGTRDGADGFYAILDQTLWREAPEVKDDKQGIAMYFFYEYDDDGDVFPTDHHLAVGLTWTGPIPGRNADVMGIGASYVHFTDAPAAGFTDDAELAIEAFYRLQITPWVAVKPDLQDILNPGGIGLDNALAASIRIEVAF